MIFISEKEDSKLKYSILMPIYEGEKATFFKQAVESMLRQTRPPDEFVLVCDGALSKQLDAMIHLFEKNNPGLFQVIRIKDNRGLGYALNIGVRVCKNELIARMDSDDVACPWRCERQLEAFDKDPGLSLCSGTIAEFAEDISRPSGFRRLPSAWPEIIRFAKRRNPMNHMAVMFRKPAVQKAGNYREIKGAEDYYLWVRMLQAGYKAANIDEVLVYARTGNGMLTRRGGLQYAKNTERLQHLFWKIGFLTFPEYLVNSGTRIIVSLLPKPLRKFIYIFGLREANHKRERIVTKEDGAKRI